MLIFSHLLFSQADNGPQEFGITTGAFTNFPANQHYLTENMSVFYVAPYLRTGRHEFSAGMLYPLSAHGLNLTDYTLDPRPGAIAGYKFYVFNVYGRENMFIHYSFQYLRFAGTYDIHSDWHSQTFHVTETDMYINNVIGLGYNLFFDYNERFGLFYILDYVISQTGYKISTEGYKSNSWTTQFVWNNLSTNIGFIFKLAPLKKKEKK
jgi:hypothetical protein